MKLYINDNFISEEVEVVDSNVETSNEIFVEFSPLVNMEEVLEKVKDLDIQIIETGDNSFTLFEGMTSFKIEKDSIYIYLF